MADSILRVSLITPTYNERENLAPLVAEIFQTIDQEPDIDLELIVVDDNSPDGTWKVAETLKKKYPILISEPTIRRNCITFLFT